MRNRDMRTILILILLSSQIACADERKWEYMNWKAMPYTLGGIGGHMLERDICLRVMVHPEQGELSYGPLLLWRAKNDAQTVQISNSLSALSKAISVVIAGMSDRAQRPMIRNAVAIYCRSIWSAIMVGDMRKRVLAEIAQIDPKKAAELTKIAPDLAEQWEKNKWQLTFFILSEGGAVEKHRFRGKRDPFAINEHVTELVAEEGSMPSGRSRTLKLTPPSP